MLCPVCKHENLVMSERQGIEIDYCPQCRGVWLDRGELDKLVERSVAGAVHQAPVSPSQHHRDGHREDRHERHEPHAHGYPRRKKREGFLADIFDFD